MEQNRQKEGMERYLKTGAMIFTVVAASMLLFFCIYRWGQLMALVKKILNILKPFIYGAVIAYLLNPIFNFLQGHLQKVTEKLFVRSPKRARDVAKVCSSIISVALVLTGIYALFALIVPGLYDSIMTFVDGFSGNVEKAELWLREFLDRYPDIEPTVMNYYDTIVSMAENWLMNTFLPGASVIFNSVTNGLAVMFTLLKNLFIGIIVAIYLLNEKEVLLPQCRKLIYGVLKKEQAQAVLREFAYADQMFSGYVYGKIIDALMVGMLLFIIGTPMGIPYIGMISVVVGASNLIPFFGPYIGGIPSALIILLVNPMKCLQFVIALVILQQIDGNFLEPKIMGNTTGLSSFWVLFSILFFGGLWGIVGMIVGIPVFAVLYHMVAERINENLRKRGMRVERTAYQSGDNGERGKEEIPVKKRRGEK